MVVDRPAPKLKDIWIGANFWSRAGGPLMWRRFDEAVVRQELRVLRRHGVTVTRSFCYWPDFMPAPDTIAEPFVERLGRFLDLTLAEGMLTIPTFIVGHMSGENWDVPWRAGRDLYQDGWMLAQQAFFIQELASRFYHHPAISAWLISNEMPIYGGATSAEYGRSWARLMVQAVRAAGARQPVSLGDGAWGIELTGVDNGFRLRDLSRIVDFIGPHAYPMTNDPVRQHLTAAFACELSHFGLPVVLEEFGLSSDHAADTAAADYYRQVLHSSLLAGATGWLAWNNTDFDLPAQDPYRHHPFELHFGLTRVDGSVKPALIELERFAKLLKTIDFAGCSRVPSDTALVIPSYFDTEYPFTSTSQRPLIGAISLQAYIAAREAGLSPALVRELDGIPAASLILVPSTQALTAPTWSRLDELATSGSTVYCSYFSGGADVQRASWHPDFNRFFGVEHQLRYGLLNPVPEQTVTLTFEAAWGDLEAGTTLTYAAAGTDNGRAFLPVMPREARVLARDQDGRPALLVRDVGLGKIVLSTYPTEYFASARPMVNPEDTWRLYHALGAIAGVEHPVASGRPEVLVDALQHSSGTRYAWFISEAPRALSLAPILTDGWRLSSLDGQSVDGIELPAYGVAVYRLEAITEP